MRSLYYKLFWKIKNFINPTPKGATIEWYQRENNILRNQRNSVLKEKVEAEEKHKIETLQLRKRIDELVETGCKYRSEKSEIEYMVYDFEHCIDLLGRRGPDDKKYYPLDYGVTNDLLHIRDIMETNETYLKNYYKKALKG